MFVTSQLIHVRWALTNQNMNMLRLVIYSIAFHFSSVHSEFWLFSICQDGLGQRFEWLSRKWFRILENSSNFEKRVHRTVVVLLSNHVTDVFWYAPAACDNLHFSCGIWCFQSSNIISKWMATHGDTLKYSIHSILSYVWRTLYCRTERLAIRGPVGSTWWLFCWK